MNTQFETSVTGKQEWLTPPGIIRSLGIADGTQQNSNAGAPSCLIAYGQRNAYMLADARIKGKFIWLNK